jgi:hypothetical protein
MRNETSLHTNKLASVKQYREGAKYARVILTSDVKSRILKD